MNTITIPGLPASWVLPRIPISSIWVALLSAAFVFPTWWVWEPLVRAIVLITLWYSEWGRRLAIAGLALWFVPAAFACAEWMLLSRDGTPRVAPEAFLAMGDAVVLWTMALSTLQGRLQGWSVFMLCGFLAWGHLSALLSPDLGVALDGLSVWRLWVLGLLFSLFIKVDSAELAWGLLKASLIVVAIGLMQVLVRDYSYVLDAPSFDDYMFRVQSTYYRHNSLVLAVGMVLVFSLPLLSDGKYRLWSWLSALMSLALLMINGTRAVSLSIMAASFAFMALSSFKARWFAALAAIVVAVIMLVSFQSDKGEAGVAGAYGGVFTIGVEGATSSSDSIFGRALDDRALLLMLGAEAVKDQPFFGSGASQLKLSLSGDRFTGATTETSSHSMWVDIAAQAGVPALAFLVVGLALLAFRYFQAGTPFSYAGISLLVYFGAAWVFFVQQVDHTYLIAFALLGSAARS